MMERPRRRALPRAAKKLDHTRREENASRCRVVVNDAGEDDDIIKVLSCTRLSLSLSFSCKGFSSAKGGTFPNKSHKTLGRFEGKPDVFNSFRRSPVAFLGGG